MTSGRRRLLTISHSYCVALNRRLPQELARNSDWDVTAVGPATFPGDFGWHTLEAAGDEPCKVVGVPVRFSRRIHVMRYGGGLRQLLNEHWDLVHCWEEPYVAAAAQVARRVARGVPLVFATFQNISKRYPPPFSWFERASMARADGIIAFGRTAADVVAGRGVDGRPLAIIPPGVDLATFRPDAARRAATLAQLGWAEGTAVVGFVGRLVREKGIELLMQTLDGLSVPWRALVVGSGPLDRVVGEWASRHGDRVRCVAATHEEVPAYLNAMDVLCAPSRTTRRWREQFGRMLVEAFASGVAVIASDSGEIPHVVSDAGILLPEDDVRQWQQAIESLLADRARRCELARRGYDRAQAQYGWPLVAQQHLDFFDRVIGARS
jgi:glycosyltransferase involved in cell wall biosynthesis